MYIYIYLIYKHVCVSIYHDFPIAPRTSRDLGLNSVKSSIFIHSDAIHFKAAKPARKGWAEFHIRPDWAAGATEGFATFTGWW